MATIDELLDGPALQEDVDEVIHVDPVTRELLIPTTELILGVVSDERAECKYFKMPKTVGNGVDVTACKLRVVYTNANGESDYYSVKELVSDDDAVVFCWELSRKVTAYDGNVTFSVCVCWTVDGNIQKEWNTTDAVGRVLPGHADATPEDLTPTPDVLAEVEGLLSLTRNASDRANESAQYAERAAAAAEGLIIESDGAGNVRIVGAGLAPTFAEEESF